MPGAVAGAQRGRGAPRDVLVAGQRAPVGDAPADEPERIEGAAARMLGEDEPRARVRRRQNAVELLEQLRQPRLPAPQPGRPLEALRSGCRAHLFVDVRQDSARRIAAGREQRERRVQLRAVDVRVEVMQARRHAAPHLAVGRRVLAPRQLAPAVAQPEQRVELLDQLGRQVAPA
jgi:hypothetical protein